MEESGNVDFGMQLDGLIKRNGVDGFTNNYCEISFY